MGFFIHGRHARILARVFGVRSEDRGGVGGGGGVGAGAGGKRNTVLQFLFRPNTSEKLN